MNQKLKLASVPMGIAALTAMMFAPLANAAGITDLFGGNQTAASPGVSKNAGPAVPGMTDEQLQRYVSDVYTNPTSAALFNGAASPVSPNQTSQGVSPSVGVSPAASPGNTAEFQRYVSNAPVGEFASRYFKSAAATPDSVQVLGSGTPVTRWTPPVLPTAPVAPAVADYCAVNNCVDAPSQPPVWNPPVVQVPQWDVPIAVAQPTATDAWVGYVPPFVSGFGGGDTVWGGALPVLGVSYPVPVVATDVACQDYCKMDQADLGDAGSSDATSDGTSDGDAG
jgi:hypothetical protein